MEIKHPLKIFLSSIFEDTKSKRFWLVNYIIGAIIVASLFVVLLETSPTIHGKYGKILLLLERIFTIVFTVDYIARIYLAKRKLSYLFSFYGIIDLVSVVPMYLALVNLQFLQILRVARLLRLLRLVRFLKILRLASYRRNNNETEWEFLKLNLAVYLVAYILLTVTFSVILFHIEIGVPGTQIVTIQDAVWSVISALSSVGFGDTFPVSFLGRIFLGFVMLVGVGFLSFAILILGRVFQVIIFGRDIEKELRVLRGDRDKFQEIEQRILEEEERSNH